MDRQTAISKIKKCLALSQSANEHEAAAALRQAQALMREHGISDTDVLVSDISECGADAGVSQRPPQWMAHLALVVAHAFGCKTLFSYSWRFGGTWKFIGALAAPEVAQYAYEVLLRQLKKERRAFVTQHCKRLKPTNKTRRADLFCDAWVCSVSRMVGEFATTPTGEKAITAYMESRYSNTQSLEPTNRNQGRNLNDRDHDAIAAGASAGRRAQLHRGVGGTDVPLALT